MEPKKAGGPYHFTTNDNYEDYSSGRVLYGATGASNFPVRLASEIFQRSIYYLKEQGGHSPYAVYDPFCGAAYSLTVLGFLHGRDIKSLTASDTDKDILKVAEKNLSLLTSEGLKTRIKELETLEGSYHKKSHGDAIQSAKRLAKRIPPKGISSKCFQYNMLVDGKSPVNLSAIDLIITDLPYGKLNQWQGLKPDINPAQRFLDNIKGHLKPTALVSISSNKKQKILHEGFQKTKSFKLGTRKVLFLKPIV